MRPVQILVFTAMWKRYAMSELFAQAMRRFIFDSPDGFHVKPFAVVSDEESANICRRNGFYYVMHENNPLGKKMNYGLQQCKGLPFDYLMLTGDDDLWNSDAWNFYRDMAEHQAKFFGFREAYIYSSEKKKSLRFRYSELSGKVVGSGRMISRGVIEQCGWKLWDDHLDNMLDGSFDRNVSAHGVRPVQMNAGPMHVDIKSGFNIWGFSHLEKFSWNVQNLEALGFLPKSELNLLSHLKL